METIFLANLTQKLVKEVRGKVTTRIANNILCVKIHAPHDIVFTYYQKDIAQQILQGTPTDLIVRRVEQQYRKTISSIFFK